MSIIEFVLQELTFFFEQALEQAKLIIILLMVDDCVRACHRSVATTHEIFTSMSKYQFDSSPTIRYDSIVRYHIHNQIW